MHGGRCVVAVAGTVTGAVGRHSVGNSAWLPGRVVCVCPPGLVQMTVPSGSCRSRQPCGPPQKVLK